MAPWGPNGALRRHTAQHRPAKSLSFSASASGSSPPPRTVEPTQLALALSWHPLPVVALEGRVGDARLLLQPGDLDAGPQRGCDERVLRRVDSAHPDAERPEATVPVAGAAHAF